MTLNMCVVLLNIMPGKPKVKATWNSIEAEWVKSWIPHPEVLSSNPPSSATSIEANLPTLPILPYISRPPVKFFFSVTDDFNKWSFVMIFRIKTRQVFKVN